MAFVLDSQGVLAPVRLSVQYQSTNFQCNSCYFIEVSLLSRNRTSRSLDDAALLQEHIHFFFRESPIPSDSQKFVRRVALGRPARTSQIKQSIASVGPQLDMLVHARHILF